MGKQTRQSRLKPIRKTPVNFPVDENVRKNEVLPLISALKSFKENERLNAITAICEIIKNRAILHMFLRERLIKIILSSTLNDSNLEIVAGSMQVLRAISLSEGRDPSLYMVRENIKLPLQNISAKVMAQIQSSEKLTTEQHQLVSLLAANCMSLVSALLIAIGEFSGIGEIVKLALLIISVHDKLKFSDECIADSFELLYYGSESEPDAFREASEGFDFKQLHDLAMQTNNWQIKTYACGVVFNLLISSSDFELENEEGIEKIRNVVKELCTFFKTIPEEETSSLQVCLELLAIAAQTEDIELIEILVTEARPRVLELMHITDLKMNCISVLNNIGWSLNGMEHDWTEISGPIVTRTMETCFPAQSNLEQQDPELISMALGLLASAVLQQANSISVGSAFTDLVTEVNKLVENLYSNGNELWVDVARSLIVLLAIPTDEGTIASKLELLRLVSERIFLVLEQSKDPEAHIDVLNALYDVFGDNEAPFNEVEYNQQGLNDKLEQLKPAMKRSLKSIPKTEPAKRQQGIDALTNLEQFIIYKKS